VSEGFAAKGFDGDFVIVHGRFSGFLPVNWIAADILRIEDGTLVNPDRTSPA
jgi:hypothetical protein